MSRRWRWYLLGTLVAIVITGLMPNALLSGAEGGARSTVGTIGTIGTIGSIGSIGTDFFTPATVALPVVPTGCLGSSCSRGAPSPAAPTLTLVAAAALVGVLSLAVAGRRARRMRSSAAVLPRGNFMGLFHPPQFS
jgi:hypothetical protein